MKNRDSGSFVTLCLMLLTLVTSWPSFDSSIFSSSMSAPPERPFFFELIGMEVDVQGPKYLGKLPVGFWVRRQDFDFVVGYLQVVVLLGDISLSLSKDLIIVWMSMTSLTNIGEGRFSVRDGLMADLRFPWRRLRIPILRTCCEC